MEFSLALIAEQLRAQGHEAQLHGAADTPIAQVRMLDGENGPLHPRTLYIASRIPEERPSLESCAFALAGKPPTSGDAACLVVEDASEAQLMNAISAAIDGLARAIEKAQELSWEPNGVVEIVNLLKQLVGNPVYVVDSGFKVLAITHDPDMEEMSVNWMNAAKHGYLSYDLIANLIRSNELHDIESSPKATVVHSEFFYTPFANYNLRQVGKVQGHLFVVQMYKDITQGDLEIIDLIAAHILHALQANRAFQVRRGALYENFVIDWIEGNYNDPSYVRTQLDALSFTATDHVIVAIIKLMKPGDFRREHLARLLEDRQGCRTVNHNDQVIALFQLKKRTEKQAVLRKVQAICRNQDCIASLSEVQDTLMDTPRAYHQALEALRIRDVMGLPDEVVRYGDIAAYQPYLNFSSIDELDTFLHPAIRALRDYDRTHAVQLLPTLSSFLKHDRDTQITAAALYIHRNTLTYRMKKILDMCPVDLDDFNTRHRLLESILIVENYDGITAQFHTN